ncbi:MAG: carbohydrate binding domain-containing protein [Victivallales bacterium]|nr:carbohydrate binding domain-containing protein [Victivallales bacterium]
MQKEQLFIALALACVGICHATEVINGGFEHGAQGWVLKGDGLGIDGEIHATGKRSLRISQETPLWQRAFQRIAVEPNATYRVEFLVKCQNVTAMPDANFGGASSKVNQKEYFPQQGLRGAWNLDVGTLDWTRVSYSFTTSSDEETVELQFQLSNATGTMWVDDVTVTKVISQKQTAPISAEMYPLRFLGETPFRIAENLPGTIVLQAYSDLKSKDQGELLLELPDFVTVTGCVPTMPTAKPAPPNQRRTLQRYDIERLADVQRDGKTVRLYRILLDRHFNQFLSARWYGHHVFLKADTGSAGKRGALVWQVKVGAQHSHAGKATVEIGNPVVHQEAPCRQFGFMLPRSMLPFVDVGGHDEVMDFWSRIAEKRYNWIRACDEPANSFIPIVEVGGIFWNVIPALQPRLNELARILPPNINDKGKRATGFAIWSEVDDRSGLVGKFFREALREVARLHPEARDVVWDFEPHPYGYDAGGRERFARSLGLANVPSIEEINGQHRRQWFQYMVDLHAQYMAKFTKILKEELPQVRFWFCSDPLNAGPNPLSSWCGVDVRLSDADVDVHHHMPYYAGARFFDDIAFNIASLKKPFFPLIDPSERLASFYVQYTPPKVLQNILAVAALGGTGIGFWPDDAFTCDYYQAISQGFGLVSRHEDFYFSGKRTESIFTFIPVNSAVKMVKDKDGGEHALYFPDLPANMRVTVHHWNSDYLFTIFNYDGKHPALWKVKGLNREFLAEVAPDGVSCFLLSRLPKQQPLQEKAREYQQNMGLASWQEIHDGKNVMEWCAGSNGEAYLKMDDGRCTARIDLMDSGEVKEIFNASGCPLLHDGFIGRLNFYDAQQRPLTVKGKQMEVTSQGPQLRIEGIVGPYAGANPTPNPLFGMEVSRLYRLEKDALRVEWSFRNPTDKTMVFGFRAVNYPHPGKRFGADKVQTILRSTTDGMEISPRHDLFARPGQAIPFADNRVPEPWDGAPVELLATKGALKDFMRFIPSQDFAGLYFWFSDVGNTIECLTDTITLPPLAQRRFRYQVEFPVQ